MATGLNYVPIPENVVDLVKDSWKKTIKAGGKPVYK
jgi:phosphate transport system substrate-binding protein